MAQPENSPDIVCVDGVCRPDLSVWAVTVQNGFSDINLEFTDMQRQNPSMRRLLQYLLACAGHVEPLDPALGIDPLLRKSNAFRSGIATGALLVSPLFKADRRVLKHATNYAQTVIGSAIQNISGSSDVETASNKADWLMNEGGYGRTFFNDVEGALDELTDKIEPDITSQLCLKAGAGLCMLTVWEGYRFAEIERMEEEVTISLRGSQLDSEISVFLSEA